MDLGFGKKLLSKVLEWISERHAKDLLLFEKINDLLGKNPHELAKLYIEPDFQPYNPANLPSDKPDPMTDIHRIPAFSWLDTFLIESTDRDGRHVVFVLSDAGMGKSSLLAMLMLSKGAGLWPTVQFEIFKLGETTLEQLRCCAQPSRTVLLLDSLDEDPTSFGRIEERIKEILRETKNFRHIIVTCRTQFFPLSNDYTRDGGRLEIDGFRCRVTYLSLFSDKQVDDYIERLFPGGGLEADRTRLLVQSMGSLRMRPMLLAYSEDLLDADIIDAWTSLKIYRALVRAWLRREVRKLSNGASVEDLQEACYLMAIHLQSERTYIISKDKLRDLLARSAISDALTRVDDFGGRSLLNRNSDGDYRFAHYSIQEFLVVDHMIQHPDRMGDYSGNIRYSDELVSFLLSWLKEAPFGWKANLRGADMSNSYLKGANLSEADLSGANLRKTNLSKASLCNADLLGADLGGAKCTAADLSGVNLSGANLSEGDFTNADLTRVNFSDSGSGRISKFLDRLQMSHMLEASTIAMIIRGANLQQAKISQIQVNLALGDNRTLLPKGIEYPDHWP